MAKHCLRTWKDCPWHLSPRPSVLVQTSQAQLHLVPSDSNTIPPRTHSISWSHKPVTLVHRCNLPAATNYRLSSGRLCARRKWQWVFLTSDGANVCNLRSSRKAYKPFPPNEIIVMSTNIIKVLRSFPLNLSWRQNSSFSEGMANTVRPQYVHFSIAVKSSLLPIQLLPQNWHWFPHGLPVARFLICRQESYLFQDKSSFFWVILG